MTLYRTLILSCLVCGPVVPVFGTADELPAAPPATSISGDVRRAQVTAATADALGSLTRDVMSAPVAGTCPLSNASARATAARR